MVSLFRQPNHVRHGRISFKILILVFIFGYCYKSIITSFGGSYSASSNNQTNMFPKYPMDGLPYQVQASTQDEKGELSHLIPQDEITNSLDGSSLGSFTRALENLFLLLPDDSHVEDLVSPIEGTAEAKIREVGFRARAFKALFETWETLHLVPRQDELFVRENGLQYLKSHLEISKKLDMDHADMIHAYEYYRSFLTQLSTRLFPWTMPYFGDLVTLHSQFWNAGQGLVFTAGNKHAPYLLTSIQSLRKIGCHLPIEVMYLGDSDLGEDNRGKLEAITGVITRDLSPMINNEGWKLTGWAVKPFAILLSTFREVIFIDADALFLRDPAVLFQDADYQKTGALFFKDRIFQPAMRRSWLKQILPTPVSKLVRTNRFWTGESGHMQESGVIVVDKWRHFLALLVITRMNGPDRDGNKGEGKVGVYDMVFGDKETFWLGWELVGDTGYAFHDGGVAVMGVAEVERTPNESGEHKTDGHELRDIASEHKETKSTICAPQMLHLDVAGRPLWFNGWVLPNKFSNDPHLQPVNFESFISEPSDVRGGGGWKMGPSNVFCLSSDHISNFTRAEKAVLEEIIHLAKGVGAIS